MKDYSVDNIIEVSVTGIEKYGIFVKVDSKYNGLIHISEISDSFVRNMKDYVNLGDTILAKILEIDEKNCHLKLSIKDINYKNNKGIEKIVESPNGFKPLAENLKIWTEEKLKEYEE